MKNMDRLYERLTPVERFQIAVAAFGRGDMAEVDRLNDATTWRSLKIQEPAYFDRLQRITWLALFFTVQTRNTQIAVVAGFAAMMIHFLSTDSKSGNDGWDDAANAKLNELVELCSQRIACLKGLRAVGIRGSSCPACGLWLGTGRETTTSHRCSGSLATIAGPTSVASISSTILRPS